MSTWLSLENTTLGTKRLVIRQHDFGGTAKTLIADHLNKEQVSLLQEAGVCGPNPHTNYGNHDLQIPTPKTPLPPVEFKGLEEPAPARGKLIRVGLNTAVDQSVEDRLNQYESETGAEVIQIEKISEGRFAPRHNGGEEGVWYSVSILARGPITPKAA